MSDESAFLVTGGLCRAEGRLAVEGWKVSERIRCDEVLNLRQNLLKKNIVCFFQWTQGNRPVPEKVTEVSYWGIIDSVVPTAGTPTKD